MHLTLNHSNTRENRANYSLSRQAQRLFVGFLVIMTGLNSWATETISSTRLETYIESMNLKEGQNPSALKKAFSDQLNELRNTERKQIQEQRNQEFARINADQKEFIAHQKTEKENFFKGKPSPSEKKDFNQKHAEERKNFFERNLNEKKALEISLNERKDVTNKKLKDLTDKFNTKYAVLTEEWKKISAQKESEKKLEKQRHLDVLKDLDKEYESVGKKKPVKLQAAE